MNPTGGRRRCFSAFELCIYFMSLNGGEYNLCKLVLMRMKHEFITNIAGTTSC